MAETTLVDAKGKVRRWNWRGESSYPATHRAIAGLPPRGGWVVISGPDSRSTLGYGA